MDGPVITDEEAREDLHQQWFEVRLMQGHLTRDLFASGAAGSYPHGAANACFSIVMVWAYGVLHNVLRQLHQQGRVVDPARPQSTQLGILMAASRRGNNPLPWQDYDTVASGQQRRNEVAHRCLILQRGDAWAYISAIERELVGWHIIPGPVTEGLTEHQINARVGDIGDR
jgi:hypothetical protein